MMEIPVEVIDGLKEAIDCKLYFMDQQVDMLTMYLILGGSVIVLLLVYIMINGIFGKKARR